MENKENNVVNSIKLKSIYIVYTAIGHCIVYK